MAGPVPSFCDHCENIFPSRLPQALGIRTGVAHLEGNLESCPRCGKMARVMDGTYHMMASGLAQILDAPEHSRRDLARLREILNEAREGKATQEEVERRVEEELPGLAHAVGTFLRNTSPERWMMAATLAVSILQWAERRKPPVVEVDMNVDVRVENVLPEIPTPPPPDTLRVEPPDSVPGDPEAEDD